MARKVGNDGGKVGCSLWLPCARRGVCTCTHTCTHHESGVPLLYLCSPASRCLGGRMQLERKLQPHVDPPVSTSPAPEVKAKSFLLVINHLVCGLLQRQHKADEDRTLGRLLPIFLHTDSCSINCSNVLQEQAARSIKLNSAHEYQPPTQGFILHRHPHTSKNMYDESHYLQYPG